MLLINAALKKASEKELKYILGYTDMAVFSQGFVHDAHSSIVVDSAACIHVNDNFHKISIACLTTVSSMYGLNHVLSSCLKVSPIPNHTECSYSIRLVALAVYCRPMLLGLAVAFASMALLRKTLVQKLAHP